MVTNYLESGKNCPKCDMNTLYSTTTKNPMIIDDEEVWPYILRCRYCGWELSEEDVIKSWREFQRK